MVMVPLDKMEEQGGREGGGGRAEGGEAEVVEEEHQERGSLESHRLTGCRAFLGGQCLVTKEAGVGFCILPFSVDLP